MTDPTRNDAMSALGSFFEAIGAWSYDHRWVVLFASFAVWGLGGYLSSSARVDNSVASFFDTDDPTYGAYLDYRDDFESDEVGYVVYRAPGGAWNLESMKKVEELTRELEDEVPFVKEVTSLSNVEFMEGALPLTRYAEENHLDRAARLALSPEATLA